MSLLKITGREFQLPRNRNPSVFIASFKRLSNFAAHQFHGNANEGNKSKDVIFSESAASLKVYCSTLSRKLLVNKKKKKKGKKYVHSWEHESRLTQY